MTKKIINMLLMLALVFTLASCSDDDNGGPGASAANTPVSPEVQEIPVEEVPTEEEDPAETTLEMTGIAATGFPIILMEVSVQGSNGEVATDITNFMGGFLVDLDGLESPYLAKVTTLDGDILFAIATKARAEAGKEIHLTLLSTVLVYRALDTTDDELIWDDFVHLADKFTPEKLAEYKQILMQRLMDRRVVDQDDNDFGLIIIENSDIDQLIALLLDDVPGTLIPGSGEGLDKLLDALELRNSSRYYSSYRYSYGGNCGESKKILRLRKIRFCDVCENGHGSKEFGNEIAIIKDNGMFCKSHVEKIGKNTIERFDQLLTLTNEISDFLKLTADRINKFQVCNTPNPVDGPNTVDGVECNINVIHQDMTDLIAPRFKMDGLDDPLPPENRGRSAFAWFLFCKDTFGDRSTQKSNCDEIDIPDTVMVLQNIVKVYKGSTRGLFNVPITVKVEFQLYQDGVRSDRDNDKFDVNVEADDDYYSSYGGDNHDEKDTALVMHFRKRDFDDDENNNVEDAEWKWFGEKPQCRE